MSRVLWTDSCVVINTKGFKFSLLHNVSQCINCVMPNGEQQHNKMHEPSQDANLTACKCCHGGILGFRNYYNKTTDKTNTLKSSDSLTKQVTVATSAKQHTLWNEV